MKHSKETRELIKQNVQKSIAIRAEKVREFYKNNPHPNKGKKLTEEHKKKVGQKSKEMWANMSDEQREKISQERRARFKGATLSEKCLEALTKGREKKSGSLKKQVGKYTMNDEFIESYNSISEASVKNGITHSSISKTCRGVDNYKSAGGFKWKHME